MKMLVTGATGFLGKRLAHSLLKDGHEVTGLGRNKQIGRLLEQDGIPFIQAELSDKEAVRSAIARGFDVVVHCGALSASWGKDEAFEAANIRGTAHVAEACLLGEVPRLIHISTPSVYFGLGERTNVRENDPLPAKQISAYARTKLAAEHEVLRVGRSGLGTIILRPRALYGPGDRTILPRLIEANEQTGVPFIGGGEALIDLTYIDDAVRAIRLAATAPVEALGGIYNISGGQPIRFAEAAELLFAKLGKPLRPKNIPFAVACAAATVLETAAKWRPSGGEPLLTRSLVGMLGSSQTLDIQAARAALGYEPAVGIDEGLDHFVKWWQEQQREDGAL
ncbi:NAD(P)-dependent oxidoreductase [Saccharibacillus sacchari]|uniref:NAD(P)-dependent oxidoreductase n=1 Tax=Saccharibacillus sacchari TaxID=456493 RepID=A0ACC6PHA9_9BACL